MKADRRLTRRCCLFFILVFWIFSSRFSFAQQAPSETGNKQSNAPASVEGFSEKENAILMTFEGIQEKEKAIQDSMFKAQDVLVKRKSLVKSSAGKTSAGKMILRPHLYLSESVSVNDNQDATTDRRKSLVVNSFNPGVKMDLRGKGKRIAFDVLMDNDFYSSRRSLNAQSTTVNILSNFNIKRYTLSVSENYFTNYFASSKFGVDDDRVTNNWSNSVNVMLARHYNRIGYDLEYGRTITRFEPVFKEDDAIDDIISFNQYLHLAPKTRLVFGYAYSRTIFDHTVNPDNSHGNNYSLALTGVLSRKISALGQFSYNLTDTKTDDSRSTGFSALFGYRISERTNLSVNLSRSIHEDSTKSDYSISENLALSGNHRLAFNPKFKLTFDAGLAAVYFPKRAAFTKRDRTYDLGLGLSYAFRRWIDFDFSWSQTRTESNIDVEYYSNIYTLSAQAKF